MSEETPGVVFDCNLFLQAAISSLGPAFACMNLVDQGSIRLLVSPEVLSEARDVLNRPKLTQKFATLAPERVGQFLANIEAKAVLVNDVPRAVELPHDPKDEPYINLAVASGAQYLVSRDHHLLDLMQDEQFRQSHPGLAILNPVAFLQEIALKRQREQKPEQAPERERGRDINH
jgi:uncharacterized protein